MVEDPASNTRDLEAISRILRGDTEAFRIVVEKYQALILRLCRSYMKDEQEAEDAAQEIFLRAYRSLPGFKLNRKFKNWLYTIALNHLKTRYGRLRNLENRRRLLQNERPQPGRTPEEIHLREELRGEVREALAALPSNLKGVTLLYYLEELPVQDISEITGLGHEAVKSRLFRARRKLREHLEKTQPPGTNGGIVKR